MNENTTKWIKNICEQLGIENFYPADSEQQMYDAFIRSNVLPFVDEKLLQFEEQIENAKDALLFPLDS